MNKLETTLLKLMNMLTSVEPNLKKGKGYVMVISKFGAYKKGQKKRPKRLRRPSHKRALRRIRSLKEAVTIVTRKGTGSITARPIYIA